MPIRLAITLLAPSAAITSGASRRSPLRVVSDIARVRPLDLCNLGTLDQFRTRLLRQADEQPRRIPHAGS